MPTSRRNTTELILTPPNAHEEQMAYSDVPAFRRQRDNVAQFPSKKRSVQDELKEIKQRLHKTIEGMQNKYSILGRMAHNWGKKSIWLKIFLGLAILAPIVVVAVFAPVFVAVIVGVVLGAFFIGYSVFGGLLDNHYNTEHLGIEELKPSIDNLVDLLDEMTSELDTINRQLSGLVGNMSSKNATFAREIENIREEKALFSASNAGIAGIGNELSDLIDVKMSKTTQQLAELVHKTGGLLEQEVQKREEDRANHVKALEELRTLLQNMMKLNEELGSKLLNTQRQCEILSGCTTELGDIQNTYQQQSSENQMQMAALALQQHGFFEHLTNGFTQALDDLSGLNIQNTQASDVYRRLVNVKEGLVSTFGLFTQELEDKSDPKKAEVYNRLTS